MSESPKDKFEELFRMQQSLNARIGVNTTGMSEEEQTKWILKLYPGDVPGDGGTD